ncbi:Uncharacterised protein [Ewingella americana]|uniref:EAL domain-containing protein n=1 Tax=Ewingella americana TaxID=41202 RepID=A0A377NE15_9GAMM|nr:Uncharacterised protein [Ewingella americana]
MKIQFDTAFSSNYLCQPIYSNKGKLLAVELICRFASTDSKLIMPTELVLNLLNTQQLSRFCPNKWPLPKNMQLGLRKTR